METLPTRTFSLLRDVFNQYGVRVLVHIGVSAFLIFSLMSLTGLFTYMKVSDDYEAKLRDMQSRFLVDLYEQTAQVARSDGEITGYRNVIRAFAKKGRKKPLGTFTVTAYDPIESCKPFDDGLTSIAVPAGLGVGAVDPGVIPYGSVLYLPEIERYIFACDTGSAMKEGNGRNIDILVPTVKEALEFGRRKLKVELIDLSD